MWLLDQVFPKKSSIQESMKKKKNWYLMFGYRAISMGNMQDEG